MIRQPTLYMADHFMTMPWQVIPREVVPWEMTVSYMIWSTRGAWNAIVETQISTE